MPCALLFAVPANSSALWLALTYRILANTIQAEALTSACASRLACSCPLPLLWAHSWASLLQSERHVEQSWCAPVFPAKAILAQLIASVLREIRARPASIKKAALVNWQLNLSHESELCLDQINQCVLLDVTEGVCCTASMWWHLSDTGTHPVNQGLSFYHHSCTLSHK